MVTQITTPSIENHCDSIFNILWETKLCHTGGIVQQTGIFFHKAKL
jgi:hypothetical protein